MIIIVTLFTIYYEIPWKGGIEANPAPNLTLLWIRHWHLPEDYHNNSVVHVSRSLYRLIQFKVYLTKRLLSAWIKTVSKSIIIILRDTIIYFKS